MAAQAVRLRQKLREQIKNFLFGFLRSHGKNPLDAVTDRVFRDKQLRGDFRVAFSVQQFAQNQNVELIADGKQLFDQQNLAYVRIIEKGRALKRAAGAVFLL